jgi:hypothetical protein
MDKKTINLCPRCGQIYVWLDHLRIGNNTYTYAVHYLGKGRRKKCYLSPQHQYIYVSKEIPVVVSDDITFLNKAKDFIIATLQSMLERYQEGLKRIEIEEEDKGLTEEDKLRERNELISAMHKSELEILRMLSSFPSFIGILQSAAVVIINNTVPKNKVEEEKEYLNLLSLQSMNKEHVGRFLQRRILKR